MVSRYAAVKRISVSRVLSRPYSITGVPQSTDVLDLYRELVAGGKIEFNEEQVRVIAQLRRLSRELIDYAPPALAATVTNRTLRANTSTGNQPWWSASDDEDSKMALVNVKTHAEEISSLTTPKGLLLTGPPGTGKSFLVDLWYKSLPTPYKTRKHYNELVLELYRGVWEETQRRMRAPSLSRPVDPVPWNRSVRDVWRTLVKTGSLPSNWNLSTSSTSFLSPRSSIGYEVAKRLILNHWLLVFDEVQLLDVSSAGLLADVLSWYWRMGGVVVGTSNRVPDDLYKHGVQRERLEPFVESLKARCPVEYIRVKHDWREIKGKSAQSSNWFVQGVLSDEEQFSRTVKEAFGNSKARGQTLTIFGRTLRVPIATEEACKFSFNDVCDTALGPADYISLASRYSAFFITDIPLLKLTAKNQARRFISLIDALYEARCKIYCLADADLDRLFFPDEVHDTTGDENSDIMMAESVLGGGRTAYRPNVAAYDAPKMEEVVERPAGAPLDRLSLFSGEDERFAFKRALSRLKEMTSDSYTSQERWSPFPYQSRPWEGFSNSANPDGVHEVVQNSRAKSIQNREDDDDFAAEAAYESGPLSRQRPRPPKLTPDHFWGVRDNWGAKAGDWGKGASVFSDSKADSVEKKG